MSNDITMKLTNEVKGIISGSLEDIRKQMADTENKTSARYTELQEQHDRAISEMLQLKDEIKNLETAVSRGLHSQGTESPSAVIEHKKNFNHYLRTADARTLREMEKKVLNINTDPEGGYFAPAELTDRIVRKVFESNDFRNATYGATIMQTGMKEVELYSDLDEPESNWEAENQTQAETAHGEVGKIRIPVHKMTAEPRATEEMLMDSMFNIEQWLGDKVGAKFTRSESEAFLQGNGVTRPKGILTYDSGTDLTLEQIEHIATAAVDTFDHVDLVKLRASLKSAYQQNAVWFGSREAYGYIARLLDKDDRFIFTTQDLINDTLMGRPFLRFDDMANPGVADAWTTGNIGVGYGNLKEGYTIVDRVGLTVLRDPYTSKGKVKFYFVKRTGGAVVNFEAIKLLEIA